MAFATLESWLSTDFSAFLPSLALANKLYKKSNCAAPTIKTAIVINLFNNNVDVSIYGLS